MKNTVTSLILLVAFSICGIANAQVKAIFNFDTPYGENQAVGKYIEINGAKIYYEEYGKGEPLLLIHGNQGNIKTMGNQIDSFKSKYRVIIADSRGHGKSELKTNALSYEEITADWEGLVNHLKLDSVSIIGWSDGGIIALKMGINDKIKIKKIVAMGANLRPDATALPYSVVLKIWKERMNIESKITEKDTTRNWKLRKQHYGLMLDQTPIPLSDLSKIKAKVLIIAGDEDEVKGEHSLEIYKNIPNAQLCIMPGATHFAPASNIELFNGITDRFLSNPFKRPNSEKVDFIGL
ncbi:MAG: pimeloyl-ACP methyl ester carboxylesterase [Arenicella sp.]|jgi:pimeloyl-ACP methyl ester carboxylesterase